MNNGNWESLRWTVIRNPTANYTSPNLYESHVAITVIATIPVLGIQNQAPSTCPEEAAVPAYHQCCDIQKDSTES